MIVWIQKRTIPLVLGIIVLIAAALGGVMRLGFSLPLPEQPIIHHGALMMAGFFSALISLERAFAIGKKWSYAVPAITITGSLAILLGFVQGTLLLILGGFGFVLLFVPILQFRADLSTITMALGVLALAAGNLLWYFERLDTATFFWGGFLLLTIAGERIELAQLLTAPRGVRGGFVISIGIYIAGVLITLYSMQLGLRLIGIGMLALLAWLLKYDVAMKSIKTQGLPKFIGFSLVAGYLWVGVSGILALVYAGSYAYDIMLHALFLGFVFSMIFGHAPVIFPALLGRKMRFLGSFYVHLALLHFSLLLRLIGNFGIFQLQIWGGLLNFFAILLFLVNNARALK